jgi:Secretion system C-terminal sorting domain
MKKILLAVASVLVFGSAANAQLPNGSVFPDFTLTDIHGHSHHLYGYLDSGYTVFIDISATWCPPCWAYHNGHHLDSLWAQHGPTGDSGVSSSTTNNVVVLFVQGETTSGLAELYGDTAHGAIIYTTTELPYSNVTQGNWVAGTYYPIIDDSTGQAPYNSAWNITYFPTVYMICRDHLVYTMSQPTAVEAYAAAQSVCPAYAPASGSGVDAKAITYAGSSYYVCNASPNVTIQNYSSSSTITAATVKVMDATGTVVGTGTYSGSLAPFAVTTVNIPSFAGTTFGGYKYEVNVTGDTRLSNDTSADSVFVIYDVANAASIPYSENFNGSIPYKENFLSNGSMFPVNCATLTGYADAAGSNSNSLIFEDYRDNSTFANTYVFGNFNTTGATALNLRFNVAYAQYDATSNDALSVKVSTDCGATWNTAWTQSGSALSTAAATTSEYIPSAASQWKSVYIPMNGYLSNNTVIEFVGVSNYGNDIWVDNINLANTVGVTNVNEATTTVSMSPNPAKDIANIVVNITDETNVTVIVTDMTGRTVTSINQTVNAGNNKIELATADFAAGIYNVSVVAGNTVVNQKLTVVK